MRFISSAPQGLVSSTNTNGYISVSANTTAVQLFLDPNNSAQPAMLTAPGSKVMEGRKFMVRASGNCTDVGAYNVKVGLYGAIAIPAAPTVAANWTLIQASTARAVGTTSAPWFIEAQLCVDDLSGKLQGVVAHMINNLYDASAAVTNVIGSVDTDADPCLIFCVGIDFSTGSATNIGRLKQFVLGW